MTQPANQFVHRKRIAVVNFEIPAVLCCGLGHDSDAIAARSSSLLSDMFISALTNSGVFDVIERTELDAVLREQHLGQEALSDPSTAPRLGRILGVDMILGGKLTEFGVKDQQNCGFAAISGLFGLRVRKSTARVVIDARLIDTTSAKIILAETGCAENSEQSIFFAGADPHHFLLTVDIGSREWLESRIGRATRDAVNQIADRLINMYPVEASVAAVMPDGSAVLNIGCLSGIRIGDTFDLVQISQVLDPCTNEVVYEEHQPLGTLQVIELQDNGCRVRLIGDPNGRSLCIGQVALLRRSPCCGGTR